MKKLFLFGAIALLLATVGCGDDEKKVEKDTDLSIIGTWKCIGFGTTENNKIKEIKPKDCAECYTITFKEDGTLNGTSNLVDISCTYKAVGNSIIFLCTLTDIGEMEDGDEFRQSLSNIQSFKIENNKLKLYYSKKEYLLFNPKN